MIDDIGQSGDGIGRFEGRPVYVPLALTGDALTVRLSARRGQGYAAEVVEGRALMQRNRPICRHFGTCGGCRLQHLPTLDYRRWKCRQITQALASRGIENVAVKHLIDGDLASRRRLRLAFGPSGRSLSLGFRRRLGKEIVTIDECPIAMTSIVKLFSPLRRNLLSLGMAAKGGEVSITAADNGLDLLIETPLEPDLADREVLAAFAEAQDLARLAWRPDAHMPAEPTAVHRRPMIDFGGVPTPLPIGAFLQATKGAETAIRTAVAKAIGEGGTIADLFAGCGAFSLPFADEGRKVLAIERDPAMVQALNAAALSAGLESRVQATARDLDDEPLAGDELGRVDALILDPPRAGARAQAEAIAAASRPDKVAMISCNTATFARDARILIDAGYRLLWVQPIDAFVHAAEIELVGAFERAIAS